MGHEPPISVQIPLSKHTIKVHLWNTSNIYQSLNYVSDNGADDEPNGVKQVRNM